MSGQRVETIGKEWVEALTASTYYRVLLRDGCSHDDFWKNFSDYDDLMAQSGYPGAVCRRLCERIPPGLTVLDIGAGTGAFTIPLAQTAAQVVALDPSPYHLGILAEKAKGLGLMNIRYVEAVWNTPAASVAGPVDYAVAAYSMIDPDLRGFLAAMAGCAKKGIFLIYRAGDPDPLGAFVRGEKKAIDYHYIEEMLRAMGYEPEVEFFRRDYLLPLEAVLKKYQDGRRKTGEIREYLSATGRIENASSGEKVRYTTIDALLSVKAGTAGEE
jgi:SAM-dependent methyltransferase